MAFLVAAVLVIGGSDRGHTVGADVGSRRVQFPSSFVRSERQLRGRRRPLGWVRFRRCYRLRDSVWVRTRLHV